MAIGGLLLTSNGKPLNTSMSIQRDGLRTGRRDGSNEGAKKFINKSLVCDTDTAKYNKDQNVYFGTLRMEKSPKKNTSVELSPNQMRMIGG